MIYMQEIPTKKQRISETNYTKQIHVSISYSKILYYSALSFTNLNKVKH